MAHEARERDWLAINTIRTLSMDAVQAANSRRPGTPMAMAPVAYPLSQQFFRFDPDDPIWPNRDRFVLSMGHVSMLLYSLLHLWGVKAVNGQYEQLGETSVTLKDIQPFRQPDSTCPGHMKLDNLCWIYDSNHITIEGEATKKLDVFGDRTIIEAFAHTELVAAIVSEEEDEPRQMACGSRAKYLLSVDPLDGSSNSDVNGVVGTFFGIYRLPGTAAEGSATLGHHVHPSAGAAGDRRPRRG